MTPKQKAHVQSNIVANDKTKGWAWSVSVEKGRILAHAKHNARGDLLLHLMVFLSKDNRRHSRAKKLAEKCARTFFKRPVFAGKTLIWWDGVYPSFSYRERGLL